MPLCLRDAEAGKIEPIEWREPPGQLGEYVRRVKRMMLAKDAVRRLEQQCPRQEFR